MVINTNIKVYDYYCPKCGWSEQIILKSFLYNLLRLRRISLEYIPKKCPKCNGKLKRKKVFVTGNIV